MHAQLEALQEVLLMGPGPSTVPPSIYRALAGGTPNTRRQPVDRSAILVRHFNSAVS